MQPLMDVQVNELPPIFDHRVMSDWCGDVLDEDVLAILAGVPDELRACVAEIEKAIARGDLTAVKGHAHRLKGMAGNLGAVRLSGTARGIELRTRAIEDASRQMPMLHATVSDTLAALRAIACPAPQDEPCPAAV